MNKINNIDLSAYLNELNKIKKYLNLDENNQLNQTITYLDNYVNQFKCVKESDLFSDDDVKKAQKKHTNIDLNTSQINFDEAKTKLLLKINKLINEQLEFFDNLL